MRRHLLDNSGWFSGGTKQQEEVATVGFISVFIITVSMVVYCIDYQMVGSKRKRDDKNFYATRNPYLESPVGNYETLFAYVIRKVRCYNYILLNPTPKHLHSYTLATFICSVTYVTGYCITVMPNAPFEVMRIASSVDLAFYAAAKLCLGGFFIVRYQITCRDLNQAKSPHILALWGLNLTSFSLQFSTLFSNPPYMEYIDVTYGFYASVIFIFTDSIMHLILLTLFLWPLASHVRELKSQLKSRGPLNTPLGSPLTRSFADIFSPESTSNNLNGTSRTLRDEKHRIKMFEKVIRRAALSDALAIIFTILENSFYLISVYNISATASAQSITNFWTIIFGYTSDLEAIVCALSPVMNYGRWATMWFSCLCFKSVEEVEKLRQRDRQFDKPGAVYPGDRTPSRLRKFPTHMSGDFNQPLVSKQDDFKLPRLPEPIEMKIIERKDLSVIQEKSSRFSTVHDKAAKLNTSNSMLTRSMALAKAEAGSTSQKSVSSHNSSGRSMATHTPTHSIGVEVKGPHVFDFELPNIIESSLPEAEEKLSAPAFATESGGETLAHSPDQPEEPSRIEPVGIGCASESHENQQSFPSENTEAQSADNFQPKRQKLAQKSSEAEHKAGPRDFYSTPPERLSLFADSFLSRFFHTPNPSNAEMEEMKTGSSTPTTNGTRSVDGLKSSSGDTNSSRKFISLL
jgi:hypothetical protein